MTAAGATGVPPAALPVDQLETLRASSLRDVEVQPHRHLTDGHRVTLQSGPLTALTGILVRRKTGARFVIFVNLIRRAIELDQADLMMTP